MTRRTQALGILASFLCVSTWLIGPAPAAAAHGVITTSTNYQSVSDLLDATDVMVQGTVLAVHSDGSAPSSQPASLVTIRVTHAFRGHPGKRIVVWQPRGNGVGGASLQQVSLRKDRSYLLLLTHPHDVGFYVLVGGKAGEFGFDKATHLFLRLDDEATWEPTEFGVSLVEEGAGAFGSVQTPSAASTTTTTSVQGVPNLSWSTLADNLNLSPTDVACPRANLCVFAGSAEARIAGQYVPAVAVSTGPFTTQHGVVGKTTKFPVTSSYGYPYIGCAGPSLCLASTPDGLYATTDPTSGRWNREVGPSSDIGFYQIACPTVSFCAVAAGSGVLVSRSPAVASSWSLIQFGPFGVQAISCPTTALCVAGGFGTGTVGGWLETSTNPGDASAWHGHETTYPPSAQHSGQYGVSGISCPTTAFCVAATVAGPTLVSSDPAGGIGTWTSVGGDTMPSPGTASCTTGGACAVSGVGTFTTSASAAGPGIVGFPLPGVSCVSVNFCFALNDNQLEAGTGSG
jgi:hypothetical protein